MSSDSSNHQNLDFRHLLGLGMGALGVVYGDIGTSPLYALRECFVGEHTLALNGPTIYGILSLVFWSLILVISVKYIGFILKADNKGEGGILALMALAGLHTGNHRRSAGRVLIFIGIFGAALLYGDGMLTPAISVLSAVEGLKIVAPHFQAFIIPITLTVLVILFLSQSFGTAKIGRIFGPIVLVYFFTIAAFGLGSIFKDPEILWALDPRAALSFLVDNMDKGLIVLGSVFLVVTGGEALYADMGHFGRRPIRLMWFAVVLPCLILNYLGQGALLLRDPTAIVNPFYKLCPDFLLYPFVLLTTLATVIASQAVISGVFSITRQAVQLGFFPRVRIVHTSTNEIGQVYVPAMNTILLIAVVILVLIFRSSSALAGAYGVAVSMIMVLTTILTAMVARKRWHWPYPVVAVIIGLFLVSDLAFLTANLFKILEGGWIPLLIGIIMYVLMSTWKQGRALLAQRLKERTYPLERFISDVVVEKRGYSEVKGTAIYMTGDSTGAPMAMLHNLKHNKVMHSTVIVLTARTEDIPVVGDANRMELRKMCHGFYRVFVSYGFKETPDVRDIFKWLEKSGVILDDITFFIGRETLFSGPRPGLAPWREKLFVLMSRLAQGGTAFFKIPPDQVIEVGIRIEL